jgi:type IV pilus assembly protein PilB
MQHEYIKILDKLLEQKKITKKQYKEIEQEISENNKKLEDVIVKKDIVDQEEITKIKAELNDMPYVDLTDRKLPKAALDVISYDVAKHYRIVCFEVTSSKLKIGMENPSDFKAIEAMNFLAKGEGKKAEYYLISSISLNQAFKQYENVEEEIGEALDLKLEEEGEDLKIDEGFEEAGEEEISSAPVARIVSVIVRHAVEGRASDIHIEPVTDKTKVRYRVDGVLGTSLVLPKKLHSSIVGRIKVLAKLKIDETRIPQDGRIRLKVNDQRVDFRISVLPLIGGEKVVMRILSLEKGIPKLEDLGFEDRNLNSLKESIKTTYGILLITGPTGSGKSTTLASLLSMLNKEEVNISTLEDPIEYYIEGVNQSQVRPEINYSFATGLRSLLRQDPDIFMVGEVRDKETADLCIHAGLTGHFVLSTLHTNNAVDVANRLLDMGVESYLLGSTLSGVVAQRLVRRVCDNCKKKEKIPADLLDDVKKEVAQIPDSIKERNLNKEALEKGEFYKGVGCPHCGNSGYMDRISIVEVMKITEEIKQIIMKNEKTLSIKDVQSTQDFITMKQDGIIKVLNGVTTMEEVLRVINR